MPTREHGHDPRAVAFLRYSSAAAGRERAAGLVLSKQHVSAGHLSRVRLDHGPRIDVFASSRKAGAYRGLVDDPLSSSV